MTEEEKATEYANKAHTHYTSMGKIKQAYLAGLHEGQPKWHDLRKDPKDLPTDDTKLYLVFIYIWNCNYRRYGTYLPTVCEWNKEWKRFESVDDMARYGSKNILNCKKWCEIPQFNDTLSEVAK